MKVRKKTALREENDKQECNISEERLEEAILYLRTKVNSKSRPAKVKGSCVRKERFTFRGEPHALLHCRQVGYVLDELRKAILRHDWEMTARLTMLLCNSGITRYSTVIIRTLLLLLLNHPRSNTELLNKFLRKFTGYVCDAEVEKFLKVLFALREEPLEVLKAGKHIRYNGSYTLIHEMCFRDL